ncbi:MAG: hypothetical protein QOC80_2870 [Frankiaceae bacterium]|nr:hypothetical protein [Frankiaceae bacterium]
MTAPASRAFRPRSGTDSRAGDRGSSRRRQRSPVEYVERGGEVVARHPFEAEHAKLYAFPIRADPIKLGQLCDRMFTGPTQGRLDLDPLLDYVVLTFADISAIRSSELPDLNLGYADEREAALWVPLVERATGRVMWTIAYMFVNRVAAVLGGREIYGFPKQFADIGLWSPGDDDPGQAADEANRRFSVTTETLREFKSTSKLCPHTLLTLEPSNPEEAMAPPEDVPGQGLVAPAPNRRRSWGADACRAAAHVVDRSTTDPGSNDSLTNGTQRLAVLDSLSRQGKGLAQAPDDLRAAVHLFGQLATGSVPLILLKQFRDVVDPTRACYQAVVEIPENLLHLHGGGWLPQRWRLTIDDLDGVPLYRDLGLPTTETDYEGPAFWLDFDFRIGRGSVLWESQG